MSLGHGSSIEKSGLVLHLDAANPKSYPGSGTNWIDLSGNGNNGTLTNGPSFDANNKGSIVFDGTNDYTIFNNTNTLDFNENPFTISFWFKADTQTATYPAVIEKSSGDMTTSQSVRRGWSFFYAGYALAYLFTLTDQNNEIGVGADSINFGNLNSSTWTYIAIVVNSTSITGSINGGSSPGTITRTRTASVNATTQLNIGRWSTYNRCFVGNISNVQIYNRALSASEIKQNFEAVRGRYGI